MNNLKKFFIIVNVAVGLAFFNACSDDTSSTNASPEGEHGKVDTLYISNTVYDTVVLSQRDTLVKYDTLVISKNDTLVKIDTLVRYDSLVKYDTTTIVQEPCSMTDNNDGTITITCGSGENLQEKTIYKAVCGKNPYDPTAASCLESEFLCDNASNGNFQSTANGSVFVCDELAWRPALGMEIALNEACVEKNIGDEQTYGYSTFVCDGTKWSIDFSRIVFDSVQYAGQTYRTVGIGSQMWFAENLNYADSVTTPNLKASSFCYGNKPENCQKYGRLYYWTAAMNLNSKYSTTSAMAGSNIPNPARGICPEGWHIPVNEEFDVLADFVAQNTDDDSVATYLKSDSLWRTMPGQNLFGFNGLPSGHLGENGNFYNLNQMAIFITASEMGDNYFVRRGLFYQHDELSYNPNGAKLIATSVRCLKN